MKRMEDELRSAQRLGRSHGSRITRHRPSLFLRITYYSLRLITCYFLHLDTVSLDLVVKSLAADAEALGGFEFVAAGFFQHLDDRVAFDAFEQREIRILRLIGVGPGFCYRKIRGIDFLAFGEKNGALNLVLQLPDISRPIESGEPFDGGAIEAFEWAIGLRREALEKSIGQGHDILAALAQWRQMDRNGGDTIKQVFAQLAIFD